MSKCTKKPLTNGPLVNNHIKGHDPNLHISSDDYPLKETKILGNLSMIKMTGKSDDNNNDLDMPNLNNQSNSTLQDPGPPDSDSFVKVSDIIGKLICVPFDFL